MPTPFLTAKWKYLLMLNYAIDPAVLAGLVPRGTELDQWGGQTYVSMVAFLFLGTRVKGLAIPLHRNFEEVNLRFYVRARHEQQWERGVVFVKEVVPLPAVALAARLLYGENYVSLPMTHQIHQSGDHLAVSYAWRLGGTWNTMEAAVEGEPAYVEPGSLEEFISEHYWGFARQRNGSTHTYRVDHPRWKVWSAPLSSLTCDAPALYGERFAACLAQPPASAFLADGSEVSVSEKLSGGEARPV